MPVHLVFKRGASFLHLWSEAIAWSGYDVSTCPPVGSYLHEAFQRAGAIDRFRRVCDEDEVRRIMPPRSAAVGGLDLRSDVKA